MPNRRSFLQTLSGLPVVGGLLASSTASARASAAGRDYFRELGVRPFINAAGTYTVLTASLMQPEVVEAIEYASKRYVPLNDLHDAIGKRLAERLGVEGVMVTSGAAAALTLGTAACVAGKNPGLDSTTPRPRRHGHEERGHHATRAPLRLRPRRPQLRRAHGRGGDARRARSRDQRAGRR